MPVNQDCQLCRAAESSTLTEQHCEKLYQRKQYRYDLCPAECVDLIVVDGPADEVEVIQASNMAVV